MYFAYVDDSGGDKCFALGCVIIDVDRWADIFDSVIEFRRFLFRKYGLPVRAEVKANYLIRGSGPLRKLNLHDKTRRSIYRGLLQVQSKIGARSFGIVIRKKELQDRGKGEDPFDVAWEFLIQRFERTTTEDGRPLMVLHDEGDGDRIRKLVRKARRIGTAGSHFGTGSLSVPARLVFEDPVPKDSRQSYFIQMADLVAYAAFRWIYPPPARTSVIVPQDMWDELGDARYAKVNELRKGPPGVVCPAGIVCWP
ncbi:MAG: DUF3800 domain-containing protein [Gemmatimonadota bacterium]